MDQDPRQPAKLRKRSKSRERQGLTMSGDASGLPANTSQPLAASNTTSAEDKKKKSKFRLSNPFHSKEKDDVRKDVAETKEHNPKRDTVDTNFDSAYGSSEPSSSANPSFASNPNRASGGEQWNPPQASTQQAPRVTTPPAQRDSLAPPAPSLQNRSSHENIQQETHRDVATGNIVTTTTTVCNTPVVNLSRRLISCPCLDNNYDDHRHWTWWYYNRRTTQQWQRWLLTWRCQRHQHLRTQSTIANDRSSAERATCTWSHTTDVT